MMLFVVLVAALAQVNCQGYTTTTTYTTTEYVEEPQQTWTTNTWTENSQQNKESTSTDFSQFANFQPSYTEFSDISNLLKDFEMPSAEDLKNMTPEEIKSKMNKLGDISKEIERTKKDVQERISKFNARNTVVVGEARRQVEQARDRFDVDMAKSAMKRSQGDFEREDALNRVDIEKLKKMDINGQLKNAISSVFSNPQPSMQFAQQPMSASASKQQSGQAAFIGNWY